MDLNSIYPNNVNIKYDHVMVNNLYISGVIISDISGEIGIFDFANIIPSYTKNIMSIYVQKLDLRNEIKKLSKIISETGSTIKDANSNELGIDITKKVNSEAVELRKKLQVENEEIFKVTIFIELSDTNLESLKIKLNKLISELFSKNIIAKIANFRQDKLYLDSLPIFNANDKLVKDVGISVTTSQLAYLFPYIKNELYDKNGILYGFINSSFCIYDIFSNNNMNYNMCILGSSGAGKSYFMKIMIMRNLCMNIRQVIFDIQEEYLNVAMCTDAVIFESSNWNILYIPQEFAINNKGFLDLKIEKIYEVMNEYTEFSLNNVKKEIKVIIKELYYKYGIKEELYSMYEHYKSNKLNIDKVYKKYSSFPDFKELIDLIIEKIDLPNEVYEKLTNTDSYIKYDKECVKKLDECFDNLIVFNMNKLSMKNFRFYISYIEQYYGNKLLIYIDEVWKYMLNKDDYYNSQEIMELYKTIRKKNAGIVIASQDIHDLFKIGYENFGKSILNNSYTKVFFKMQYTDLGALAEAGLFEGAVHKIKGLAIGRACMNIGNVYFNLEIKASSLEKDIIGGEINEEHTYSYR